MHTLGQINHCLPVVLISAWTHLITKWVTGRRRFGFKTKVHCKWEKQKKFSQPVLIIKSLSTRYCLIYFLLIDCSPYLHDFQSFNLPFIKLFITFQCWQVLDWRKEEKKTLKNGSLHLKNTYGCFLTYKECALAHQAPAQKSTWKLKASSCLHVFFSFTAYKVARLQRQAWRNMVDVCS